jgi:hypothetical protein
MKYLAIALLFGCTQAWGQAEGYGADFNRTVTLTGLTGPKSPEKTFMTCEAKDGRFQHCILSEGITLEDIAFWMGFSAEQMSNEYQRLARTNARLRAELKKVKAGKP